MATGKHKVCVDGGSLFPLPLGKSLHGNAADELVRFLSDEFQLPLGKSLHGNGGDISDNSRETQFQLPLGKSLHGNA